MAVYTVQLIPSLLKIAIEAHGVSVSSAAQLGEIGIARRERHDLLLAAGREAATQVRPLD
jgi:hypothetical protein